MERWESPRRTCAWECLTGIYPVEIPGERCLAAQTKLSEYIMKATEESALSFRMLFFYIH